MAVWPRGLRPCPGVSGCSSDAGGCATAICRRMAERLDEMTGFQPGLVCACVCVCVRLGRGTPKMDLARTHSHMSI